MFFLKHSKEVTFQLENNRVKKDTEGLFGPSAVNVQVLEKS